MTLTPTNEHLATIANDVFGQDLKSAQRFATGFCHYVYDVVLTDGQSAVIRIAEPTTAHLLKGAVHWSNVLRPQGVPLPQLLHAELTPNRIPYPYIVLERLPGQDLIDTYPKMTVQQKETLAHQLARIQQRVATLPEGTGFGYQVTPHVPPPHNTWSAVIEANIARSERWITDVGVVETAHADHVRQAAGRLNDYFSRIPPQPFLDDITTKNVIIHNGELSGIVDVDMICYGDRLAQLGLLCMSLLFRNLPTDYVEYWCAALQLSQQQRRALDFYTALSCLSFLGEQGQRFNDNHPSQPDFEKIQQLETNLGILLSNL